MEFTRKMVEDIRSLEEKNIDFQVTEEIKKRLFDTIVSAAAGSGDPLVAKMKAGLIPSYGKLNSTVFFSGERSSAEYSALINTCMVASSGFQDFFPSRITVNPSNAIPLLISFAEGLKLKGHDLIKAIYISYKASGAFADLFSGVKDKSANYVPTILGMAAGVGSLTGMDNETFSKYLGYALNVGGGINSDLPFIERCFPSMIARELTFLYKVSDSLPDNTGSSLMKNLGDDSSYTLDFRTERVTRSDIRCNRVDGVLTGVVEAVMALRDKVDGEIIDLRVEIPDTIYARNVSGKEKVEKLSSEELSMSLPYVLAYTHYYGVPDSSSYEQPLIDKNIKDLMGKMKFSVSENYTKLFPTFIPIKVLYETEKGMFEKQIDLPLGHFRNPATWNDLKRKSMRITGKESYTDELVDFIKNIEEKEIGELLEVIKNEPAEKKQESGTVLP